MEAAELHLGVVVADWVRNTVMLTVLAVWLIYVIVTLARGDDVAGIVWGVPVSMYFGLDPSLKKKQGSKDGQA